MALEVASPDDSERAFEGLSAAGLQVVTPPAQGLESGVRNAIRFKDPDGSRAPKSNEWAHVPMKGRTTRG